MLFVYLLKILLEIQGSIPQPRAFHTATLTPLNGIHESEICTRIIYFGGSEAREDDGSCRFFNDLHVLDVYHDSKDIRRDDSLSTIRNHMFSSLSCVWTEVNMGKRGPQLNMNSLEKHQ